MATIKNASRLLSDIANGLKALSRHELTMPPPRTPLECIQVTFVVGRKRYRFDVAHAIEAIGEDLFWDERGDWSAATHATVETI